MCALVTGVQTCALPICGAVDQHDAGPGYAKLAEIVGAGRGGRSRPCPDSYPGCKRDRSARREDTQAMRLAPLFHVALGERHCSTRRVPLFCIKMGVGATITAEMRQPDPGAGNGRE